MINFLCINFSRKKKVKIMKYKFTSMLIVFLLLAQFIQPIVLYSVSYATTQEETQEEVKEITQGETQEEVNETTQEGGLAIP